MPRSLSDFILSSEVAEIPVMIEIRLEPWNEVASKIREDQAKQKEHFDKKKA